MATFYKFVNLADFREQQSSILAYCQEQGVKGTILLASEGINGAITGSGAAVTAVLAFLRSDPRLVSLEHQEVVIESPPFKRLKVRLKREIVTLGMPEVDPNEQVGIYVSPQDWNDLISDPEVMVIDTRNQYEVDLGTFKNAQNPETESFGQFPNYVSSQLNPERHKKVALFCTGGIRCEKATSLLLNQGFKQVYHLKGGILSYLREIPEDKSLWQGDCFVFDQRIALKHGLEVGEYQLCSACGHPLSQEEQKSPLYKEGVSCPYCCD